MKKKQPTTQSTKNSIATPYLYLALEQSFREEIESGQLAAGERMPSIRELCTARSISKSTVLTAYSRLEAEGLIEARARSGYFVVEPKQAATSLKIPDTSQPNLNPTPVSASQVLLDIMQQGAAFDLLASTRHDNGHGNEQLRRSLGRALRRQGEYEQNYYDEPLGNHALRSQLAIRLGHGGGLHHAEDLIITSGCQHALLLALMATTHRGGVVAVESPGFYGLFQLLESLGLQALEIPSSAQTGISPDALELALQHWDVQALVISPCYATPTGACIPEVNKQRLLSITQKQNIPIIEDDIYGELHFGLQRPRTLYSYDESGNVLLCSSFSKSLSRDLRIGWIAPGKYMEEVKHLKLVTSLATSQTLQQGLTEFLQQGGMDRHLRHQRQKLKQQCHHLLCSLPDLLPAVTSCSRPEGGLALWAELPPTINSIELYVEAREKGVILTPGRLFTAQERYSNFLRISFAHELDSRRLASLSMINDLIQSGTLSPAIIRSIKSSN